MQDSKQRSGIRDNRSRGPAHEFLESKAAKGSDLSFVSAYFTSFAYNRLATTLDDIGHLRFLFGEPRFLESVDAESLVPPAFSLDEDGLSLTEGMRKSAAASRCAEWIRAKVEIRSVKRSGLLHGKLYHVHDGRREHAMVGSSNFTLKGLGYTDQPNIELNLVVDSDRDRDDLLRWFDEIWSDSNLTEDVRDEVLAQLERLYQHNSPEFLYFKTLFHLFQQYLSEQTVEEERLNDARFTETAIWQALFNFQRDPHHRRTRLMAAAPPPNPLRIESLSLRAYRAFSAEQVIGIGGRNAIVYGENGAGKSSIYRALRDLFARRPVIAALANNAHVHPLDQSLTPLVTVKFNDGQAAVEWTPNRHPGRPTADPRVALTALRSSFLDYHALLETNAFHGQKRPNLFTLAVETLLADFADATSSKTIAEHWSETINAKPIMGGIMLRRNAHP